MTTHSSVLNRVVRYGQGDEMDSQLALPEPTTESRLSEVETQLRVVRELTGHLLVGRRVRMRMNSVLVIGYAKGFVFLESGEKVSVEFAFRNLEP